MTKKYKFYKGLLIVCIAFILSIGAGYLGYMLSSRPATAEPALTSVSAKSSASPAATASDPAATPVPSDGSGYYYVKLDDNNNVQVFYCAGGNQQYLYNLNIDVSNLQPVDKERIQSGLIFYSQQDLIQFEEDFTS